MLASRLTLQRDEIEVSHRAGKTTEQQRAAFERRKQERSAAGDAGAAAMEFRSRAGPRPILVRFVSRRTKGRVMAQRGRLKTLNRRPPDANAAADTQLPLDNPDSDPTSTDHDETSNAERTTTTHFAFPNPVYIADDLTQRRATLAYKARQLKAAKKVDETWVYDCRVMVKDRYGRVSTITQLSDFDKFQ